MDVYFETSKGKELSVEIWFFDTVAEIKQKVQKYHGHPVSSQTLVFNGRVLQDDLDTEYYDILQNSRIQLFLPDDDLPPVPLKVTVDIPTSNSKKQLTLEASGADTVAQLKLRIHQLEQNIPPDQFALFRGSVELVESNRLAHYNDAHGSEVELVLRPVAAAGPPSSRKMRVMVQITGSSMKIPVEVSPAASVAQLRAELSELDEKFKLQLPDEYFFIHNQSAMEDDKSFTWHNVKQGDTIDIFKGKITEFSVEIWFFDNVAEIKKKVQKYHGHPVSSQILVFNGRILRDDLDTEYYDILQNSRLQLFLPDDDLPDIPLKLTVNIPTSNSNRRMSVEAAAADTVAQLKRRIHQLNRKFWPDRVALYLGSHELVDSNKLVHCNVADGSEVELVLRSESSSKITVIVRIIPRGIEIPVDVSPGASVEELKWELDELDEKLNLQLPDKYYFVYNEFAMGDDEYLMSYGVEQGGTIALFRRRV